MGADNFILMHGQHTMASGSGGTNVEHTSLGYINTLKKKYKIPVGFIDHTPYTWTPPCAVASGADVISKHLLHPKYPLGPDFQVCLKPHEMKESIFNARATKKSINATYKFLAPNEKGDRSIMRRSIVASVDIHSGEAIRYDKIAFKRPGSGIDPMECKKLMGKKAIRNIHPDEILNYGDFE